MPGKPATYVPSTAGNKPGCESRNEFDGNFAALLEIPFYNRANLGV
jgi:hypothetical protein